MVDGIDYPGRIKTKPVGFWMDTLCVPVQDQFKPYRKKSIANMRYIYQNAVAVLVLDPWLQQIPSTSTTPELLVRLCQSAWLRRLWTRKSSTRQTAASAGTDFSGMLPKFRPLLIVHNSGYARLTTSRPGRISRKERLLPIQRQGSRHEGY
jgi:hypothetical protein